MLEVRSEIHADRCIAEYRTGRIVGAPVDVREGFALRFAVLEENDATLRGRLEGFQGVVDAVLVLVVEVALELDEGLE